MLRAILKRIPLLLGAIFSVAAMAAEEAASPVTAPPPADTEAVPEERSTVLPAPVPEGVPSLQMSTDYGSPILSLGGYRPMGEMQGGAIRVEPFTIRAAVHAGVGYNDNVTLSSTNKIGSVLFTTSPSILVGLEGATQRYYFVYRGNYGVYSSSSIDNYAEHNLGLNALNQWGSRLRTLARYEFVSGRDARGSVASATSDSQQWYVNALRGTATYGADGAPGRIEGTAAYVMRRYTDQPVVGPDTREYDQFDLTGAFYWRAAPKTYALAEIRRSEITHDPAPTLDSNEMRYLVGARWEATAQTRGSARVGYLTRHFSSPTRENFSGFTYEVDASWTPLSYSAVTFTGSRATNETTEIGALFIVSQIGTLAWTHGWTDRVRSIVTLIRAQDDYEGTARNDTLYALGLRGTYAFHRQMRLGAEFRHDSRNSTVPGFDYRRNLTLLTVEASL